MVNFDDLKTLATSFPKVTEEPHFEKTSFRVKGKIFLTYDQKTDRATIKLSPTDQDVFSLGDHGIAPVDNKWGKLGWTMIELDRISKPLFKEALITAYCEVAPKSLAEKVSSES